MAVLLQEPNHSRFAQLIAGVEPTAIGAPTRLELMIVANARRHSYLPALAEELLRKNRIETLSFDEHHYTIANEAFLRYGKARVRTQGLTSATAWPMP